MNAEAATASSTVRRQLSSQGPTAHSPPPPTWANAWRLVRATARRVFQLYSLLRDCGEGKAGRQGGQQQRRQQQRQAGWL